MTCGCNKQNSKDQNLEPKQYGTVHFSSDPSGADIYVDGQILTDPITEESKKTPTTVQLLEGRRNFTLSLKGHNDESGYVDVMPNTTVHINRNLEPGKSEEGWGKPEPQIWLNNPVTIKPLQNQVDTTYAEFSQLIERNTNMDLLQLKDKLIQENIVLREVLQEVRLEEAPGAEWTEPTLPYPGHTMPVKFGFMSQLEMLTHPLI